jgi:hypothetical protein
MPSKRIENNALLPPVPTRTGAGAETQHHTVNDRNTLHRERQKRSHALMVSSTRTGTLDSHHFAPDVQSSTQASVFVSMSVGYTERASGTDYCRKRQIRVPKGGNGFWGNFNIVGASQA